MSYNLLHPREPLQMAASAPSNLRVSKESRWGDPVWRFDAVTAGCKDVALHWSIVVGPRILLTDEGYEGLLEQARRFFWSMMTASQRGRNPKVTSLPSYFFALKWLIRWMVNTRRDTFSQLTPHACWEYLSDTAERLDKRGMLTAYTMALYADTLCRIHEQSVLFGDFQDAVMASHPFGGKSANEVALDHAPTVRPGFIEAVPDPIYLGSMSVAFEWLDVRAEDILTLQGIYLAQRSAANRDRSNSYNWHLNRELSRYRFDGGGTLETPWRPPLSENYASTDLRELFGDVRDAAIVGVQGTIGLRISEVCGVVAGEMPDGALWPTCVTVSPSISGLNQLFHLHGRVYKQRDEYEEVTWLAGSRPMGTDYIPPAVKAITVLWRLFQPWRELGGRKELIVSLDVGKGFPWEKKNIKRVLSDPLRRSQRSWVEAHVDVPREYRSWQLSTHQWRKSFAMYMVRSDARMLPAVRDHFKHMSIVMTERGYLGRDPEMLGLLEDEATYAAAQFLFDATNGRPAAGRMMDTVDENRSTIQELIGTEGSDVEKVIRLAAILKDDDVRVWPSEWGNCFFRSELARCHYRAKGHFDLSARRPHYGQRRPGVCCDCANLLIFSDDVNFWEARFKSGLAVLEANRVVGEHAAAAVAEDRVRTSAAILKRLGIEVNWTPDDMEMEEANEFA